MSTNKRIGLLAAWGRYPVLVAEALRRQDYHVSCIGVADLADPALREICQDFQWIGWCSLGRAIRYFQQQRRAAGDDGRQVSESVDLPTARVDAARARLEIHQDVLSLLDHTQARQQGRHAAGRADRRFCGRRHHVSSRDRFRTGAARETGTNRRPTALGRQQADIEFGWDIAKLMGGLDIGQSICVKDRAVLAVEAIEGTDACILRAGELCKKGGFTVVKVAKPQQDMRFDVPTVGVRTLRTMLAAGANVLAIEGEPHNTAR